MGLYGSSGNHLFLDGCAVVFGEGVNLLLTILFAPIVLLGFALVWVLGTINEQLLKLWKWMTK